MTTEQTAQQYHDPVGLLKWYAECGVNETISDSTTNWFEVADNIHLKQQVKSAGTTVPKRAAQPALPTNKEIIEQAATLAAAATTLEELNEAILSFDGCSLKNTATNTVFCDGNVDSDIMVIGEAPGTTEDKIGKPFIGEAGQLLDRMFDAIGMSRAEDFYITNILPWRPPGNRKPTDAECEICLPFLKRHIELFKPKMIILTGGTSANALLNSKTGITKLRGKWNEYQVGENLVPMIAIFHPAYLIHQPQLKKQAWHDLLSIKKRLNS